MAAKKEGGPLDLSGVEAAIQRQDEGTDVEIVGLDGKTPLGLTIRVAGPDSERAQRAQEALADEMVAAGNAATKLKARDATARGIRYLAEITIDWAPAVKLGGEELAYSAANAAKLYERFRFIREQVDRAAGDRGRFMTRSPRPLSPP